MIVPLSTYHVQCNLCGKGTGTVSTTEAAALLEASKRNWVFQTATKPHAHLCPDCAERRAERERLEKASETQACVCAIHATCPLHPPSAKG